MSNRLSQASLGVGGVCVACLMTYTLFADLGGFKKGLERGEGDVTTEGLPTIAVFYPDRVYWQEFREGIQVCERKGLLKVVKETGTAVVVESSKRRLVFDWHDVRGVVEMKREIERLVLDVPETLAIVGSSNTILTQAIADALNETSEHSAGRDRGPLLLIPWASAVLTTRAGEAETPVNLLDILPKRTFRYCPNNQAQATLLVGCVLDRERPAKVARVLIVEDRHDPYSTDLAESFHRAVDRLAPGVEIDERSVGIDPSLAGPDEERIADTVWEQVERLAKDQSLWVVLPIQEGPASRMIDALRRQARSGAGGDPRSLQILNGDSIGLDILERLAGRTPFPVSSFATNSPTASLHDLRGKVSVDAQIPAEIVSSLIGALNQNGEPALTPDALRKQLEHLRWSADDPRAIGRALAFGNNGERLADNFGQVLAIEPGSSRVLAISRLPKGGWGEPVAVGASSLATSP